MSERIRVHVVEFNDRKNYMMRYVDPISGKQVTKSTKTPRKRKATAAAREWEDKLNHGEVSTNKEITWQEFRKRYEREVLSSLAANTAKKVRGVFNRVEQSLPKVSRGRLSDLTAVRISRIQTDLRKDGRAENTIAGHLAHLKAALQWAVDMDMIPRVPKAKRPKRAKKAGGATPMKGRPITTEEFERMLGAVEKALTSKETKYNPHSGTPKPERVEAWKYFLRGLWWSGLRLEESLNLYWDRPDRLCVDLTGKRPMLRIPAELEKGHKDRLLPMAPEFAQFLMETPPHKRRGRIFRPISAKGERLTPHRVSRIGSKIGKAANVSVHVHPQTGKAKSASLHDLRRSFGERWSRRVMPQDLMELMRHESIQTTMRYYVGRNANTTADNVWRTFEAQEGNISGNSGQNESENGHKRKTASPSPERTCGK